MFNFTGITKRTIIKPVTEYTCSDGTVFISGKKAYNHQRLLRVKEIFSEHLKNCRGKTYKTAYKRFKLDNQDALGCGVYRVCLMNEEDARAMNHVFRGIDEEMGYPDTFPLEVDIEIYYEVIKGNINHKPSWKLIKTSPIK